MQALETPAPDSDFIRIPNCVLQVLDRSSVDLFLQVNKSETPVLYREAGYVLSEGRSQGLADQCEETLFVRAKDYANLSTELAHNLDRVFEEDSLPALQRYEILQYAVSVKIEQSLRLVGNDEFVSHTKEIGKQICTLLEDKQILPGELFKIVRHDFHTFVHVTNVSGYAVLLAKELGIQDKDELEKIAVGGLLHDIGKRQIPRLILNKIDPLTDDEWEIIKLHPQRGYEELCQRDGMDRGQLMMVYQHHEHVNGNGYPVGILGDEIHPWAKLLAVVDVFDALTGERPYREPSKPGQVLEFLETRVGKQFDEEMVRCWASAMKKR